jgi:pectinesterase
MPRRCCLLGLLASLPLCAWSAESANARVDPADPKAFHDIQSAVKAAPSQTRGASRWIIDVAPGVYAERVRVPREAGPLLLRGAGAERTKVVLERNANDLDAAGKPIGTFESSVFRVEADSFEAQGLTIENASKKVGQAVAVRIDGDRIVFRQCALLGRQDTLLVNKGRHYFDRCVVAGTVDFIFGAATAYFDRCDIRIVGKGYVAAPATPLEQPFGLVFVDCDVGLQAEQGLQAYLARPWREHGAALYLRCRLGACIRKEGWDNWRNPEREKTARFQEAESTGPGADPAARVKWAKPLHAAGGISPAKVLGGTDAWDPVTR